MFSKRRIDVNCPDGDRFGYDYYYSGDYIRIGRDGDYMDLFPQGDMNALTLTLDRIGLENLLSYWAPVDEYYAYLLDAVGSMSRLEMKYLIMQHMNTHLHTH